MFWASNRFVWIPFYAFLLFVLVRKFRRKIFFILVLVAAMITVSDQVSSGIVKNAVHRLRPCHEPGIRDKVHLVNGICGGTYGYFSSHASNSWALAVFLVLIFRKGGNQRDENGISVVRVNLFTWLLISYACLVSYSRIYLGAHYPGDILSGIVFGSLLSFIFAHIFFRFSKPRKSSF